MMATPEFSGLLLFRESLINYGQLQAYRDFRAQDALSMACRVPVKKTHR